MWMYALSIPFFTSLLFGKYTTDKHQPATESNITFRIIAGSKASVAQFPYLVSLRYLGNHSCGGSILASEWVVTAAHCVQNRNSDHMIVVAGSSTLKSNYTDGQYRRVHTLYIHPGYTGLSDLYANDIALILLVDSFKFGDNVTCVNIQPRYPKTLCQAAGWGLPVYEGPVSNELLYVDLQLLSPGWCQLSTLNGVISKICTVPLKNTRGGTCHGDSGSGIMCNGLLSGIVSYGLLGCHASKYAPDVSTNVAYYLPWIKKHVKQFGKCPIHASSASMKSTDSPDTMHIIGFVISLLILILSFAVFCYYGHYELYQKLKNLLHSN